MSIEKFHKFFISVTNNSFILILFFWLTLLCSTNVQAKEFSFGPDNSSITASVSYVTFKKFMASFERYRGSLEIDPKEGVVKSIFLKIEAASIKSAFEFKNSIVCSSKVLDVKKFPFIIFQSLSIVKMKNGFVVNGTLESHGIKNPAQFTFKTGKTIDDHGKRVFRCSGKWLVDRKKFGVVWSKYLDHGGIIIGNYISVDWEINIPMQK